MWNAGTYQLVSEHSILSATGHGAMEIETEGSATPFVSEWEEQLEEIKQHWQRRTKGNIRRSRRDHAPCRRRVRRDEVSEKLHEIYLDLKLRKLQQFYVNVNSRKLEDSEEKETEESEKEEGIRGSSGLPLVVITKPEGASWNIDEASATQGRPEEATLEESSPEEEKTPEENIETEELKRENDEIEGSSGVPWNVDAKPLEEMMPEDPTTETSDRGTTMTEVMSSVNLGEFVLHHATDLCDRAEWINDGGELPATDGGATMAEARPANDLEKIFLSHITVLRDREVEEERSRGDNQTPATATGGGVTATGGRVTTTKENFVRDGEERYCVAERCEGSETAKEIWAEGSRRKVEDSVSISLGQAQLTVSKSVYTLIFTPTQFIINEEVLQVKREVDPVAISLGKAHNFIITPAIFTNRGGVLQVKREMGQKREDHIFNAKAGGLHKTMDPPNTLLTAENKAFDPGGSFSVFGIVGSSCFKLWDPGGRLSTAIFLYLHLEDKVNV